MLDTKERILQAAERLFIERGIEGASLRAITSEAGANIAAINYHFGSKDNLVQEVFMKYLYPLELMREEILKEAYEKAGDAPLQVRDLIRAFLVPWFDFREKHPRVMRIFLRFYGLQSGGGNTAFRKMVMETAVSAYSVFRDAVFKALPDTDEMVLKKRINIAASTAASFLVNEWLVKSLETISGITADHEDLIDHLVRMIEDGIID